MHDHAIEVALSERFGSIALDFVNTVVSTRSGSVDALAKGPLVAQWLNRACPAAWIDLLPHGPSGQRILHRESVRLRVTLDTVFEAIAKGHSPDESTIQELNRVLAWARRSSRILVSDASPPALEHVYAPLHPAASLVPITEEAIRLIGSADPARLRRCRADGCLRWFLDSSKAGRRAWCSMATCGNRAKAARYRERHEHDVDGA